MLNNNQKLGVFGEDLAEKYFNKQGFKTVERNYRIKKDEIDLIVKKRKLIIFAEVKTRFKNNLFKADEALSRAKLANFKRAVLRYCLQNNINPEYIRPDFLAIEIEKTNNSFEIKHYKNIF